MHREVRVMLVHAIYVEKLRQTQRRMGHPSNQTSDICDSECGLITNLIEHAPEKVHRIPFPSFSSGKKTKYLREADRSRHRDRLLEGPIEHS